MITQRYEKFLLLIYGFNSSKFNLFKFSVKNLQLKQVHIQIGLYKINLISLQHSFLLSTLTSMPSLLSYQVHGKKKKKTAAFNSFLLKNYFWFFLDKFIHEIIPLFVDFNFPITHKKIQYFKVYSLRFRKKFNFYSDFNDLIDLIFYNTFKGIFFPITINLKFQQIIHYLYYENFIRMLRFPISLYKIRSCFKNN